MSNFFTIDLPGELADPCTECGAERTDDCPVCEMCRERLDALDRAIALSVAQRLEELTA